MPKTPKDVQSFLGLGGYFRKFIPLYSLRTKPLSDLLKKEATIQNLKIVLSHDKAAILNYIQTPVPKVTTLTEMKSYDQFIL